MTCMAALLLQWEPPLQVWNKTFLGIFDRNLSPVPDDAFTNNDVLTSYDSYDTPVIDLTNSEDQDNSINDVIVLKDDYVDQGKLVSHSLIIS